MYCYVMIAYLHIVEMTYISIHEVVDISPRTGGILDLRSSCINGTYEIRQYICRSSSYRVMSRGDYTDMTIVGGPNNCISIANVSPYPIDVRYTWVLGGGINALLISTAILYVIGLVIVGVVLCCMCSFGGRAIRRLYDRRISSMIKPVEVCVTSKPLPSAPVCTYQY